MEDGGRLPDVRHRRAAGGAGRRRRADDAARARGGGARRRAGKGQARRDVNAARHADAPRLVDGARGERGLRALRPLHRPRRRLLPLGRAAPRGRPEGAQPSSATLPRISPSAALQSDSHLGPTKSTCLPLAAALAPSVRTPACPSCRNRCTSTAGTASRRTRRRGARGASRRSAAAPATWRRRRATASSPPSAARSTLRRCTGCTARCVPHFACMHARRNASTPTPPSQTLWACATQCLDTHPLRPFGPGRPLTDPPSACLPAAHSLTHASPGPVRRSGGAATSTRAACR